MKDTRMCAFVLAVLLAASFAGTANAQSFVSAGFKMPVNVGANVSFDCRNSTGPTITLENGQITLGGLGGEITLTNNTKLTHSTNPGDIDVESAILLDFGATVQIPKQPSLPASYYGSNLTGTGVGGNPYIFAEFFDQNGKPVQDANGNALPAVFLGRCVQGGATISADSDSCLNNPGPNLYIGNGSLTLSGVTAKVTFTNNAKFTHAATGDASVSINLIPANGAPIVWPKQPVLGGVGGNPLVYFIFKNGNQYVGTWPGQLLGRCNKI